LDEVHIYICGRSVKRNASYFQYEEGGAVPSFRSNIMGEQVANNRETQEVMYLHEEKGKWYILSEPKSPGLVKKEYIPMGNRLVYPKKWGRKRAAEVLLNHMITDNEEICRKANERLKYLYTLKEDITTWEK
jgi:hypothetical protein